MSKALGVLKLFFSLVSINSTELPSQGAPQVTNPLDRTEVYTGGAFTIPIPKNTFYDREDNTNLRLSMTTGDGKKIPPWIRFNGEKNNPKVYGFPLPGNAPHTFNFSIIAHNSQNATAKTDLIIQVKDGSFPHNHEVILSTEDLPYQDYMRNIDLRFNLVTSIANYVMSHSPSDVWGDVWVKDFDKEMTLTIVFRNIEYSPCDKKAIDNMEKKLNERNHLMVESSSPREKYWIKVTKVEVNLLGPCNPNSGPADAPVGLGWMKHVLPVLILLAVVGIPVTISIFVRKSKAKAAREMRRRANATRKEEDASFTYHTVHYNNRYPSMLSVSNNSKEEAMTDEEKNYEANANISNSRRLAIPNGKTVKIPCVQNSGTCNLNQNVEKKPENIKKPIRSMREIMYDEDDDNESAEKAELNIPVYYNIRKGEAEEAKSIMPDVNITELAGNISSKLMDIGKSVLNATSTQAEPVENIATDEISTLSSKPQDAGNPSGKPFANQQTDYVRAEGSISASPSISSKLVDFTKSMLNVSQGQSQTPSDTFENESSTLTKLKHFGKSVLSLAGGQGLSNDDPSEPWEPYGYSDNETSQLYGWDDAHGDYGPSDMEISEYDTPSHVDECCYNFYDVTTNDLEYRDHTLRYTGETETNAPSCVYDEYRDVDMNKLYRQKEEEASRFMRSFVVDSSLARNEWELGDTCSDRGIYNEYVNPYHYDDGARNQFSLTTPRGRSRLSSENFCQDEYGKENLHRSQQECFSSMPELFEQPPGRQRPRRQSGGERGASLLGSIFSLKQQDKDDSGSITGFFKTQVKGILGQSEGNVSKWLFQSDSGFT